MNEEFEAIERRDMKLPTRKDVQGFLLGLAVLVAALYLTPPAVTGSAPSAIASAPSAADRGSETRSAPRPANPGEMHDAQGDGAHRE
jgi:hypothetical protein